MKRVLNNGFRTFATDLIVALLLMTTALHPYCAGAEEAVPFGSAASGRTTTESLHTFHSESLGREVSYVALVPEPVDPERRYPVLYLLHGATGSYRDWTSNTSVSQVLAGRPMIVITPDGGPFGWYADSPHLPDSRYESFITKELIKEVDGRLPTLASRSGRGIAGLSMGGHGALSLAVRHPELFTSASSMSGILHLRNHPTSWKLDQVFGELPQREEEWQRHSVYDLAEHFTTAGLHLHFDCGTSDTAAIEDNRQTHERFTELKIPHRYVEHPGGHTWDYWRARLPEHLEFHEQAFAGELNR